MGLAIRIKAIISEIFNTDVLSGSGDADVTADNTTVTADNTVITADDDATL